MSTKHMPNMDKIGGDDVETIVGPSVKVEGDFVSQGNIVIEGQVSGSIKTDKNLRVEQSAKIAANVSADSALVAGEVKGNIKAMNTLELTPSARVEGDLDVKTLIIAASATLNGRCIMGGDAGLNGSKGRAKSGSYEDNSLTNKES